MIDFKGFFRHFKSNASRYSRRSFAQEGEDLLIDRFLNTPSQGFYIDVGAHHPQRFSNTYTFYLRGWRGINVDAMPDSMKPFERMRPRDVNLEMGVAEIQGDMTYYMFDEPALNGFSSTLTEARKLIVRPNGKNYTVIGERSIPCAPLKDILDRHLGDQAIDFLTIDVEGLDLQVLRSNDWSRYRPTLILVECIDLRETLVGIATNPTVHFMAEQGYSPVAKTFNTVFFKNSQRRHT